MKPLPLLLISTLFLSGCKKKDEVTCIADRNGNHTITIRSVKDGSAFFSSSTAQVKAQIAFEQYESPGTNDANYDLVKNFDLNSDVISFKNLNCGIYYCRLSMTDHNSGINYEGESVIRLNAEETELSVTIELFQE
ncbi:MAG: hypothetical protein LC117_07905 [Bacteroidia bacterium]|nr:hypothetical protein [Bacteroidia bacterium]MCZ2277835.1 hypothetical protein [Bacteroidia bacterium]